MTFERELAEFDRLLPALLEKGWEGFWVIVRGSMFLGPYAARDDAMHHGYQTHGIEPFMVRRVLREQPVLLMPSFTIISTPQAVQFCEGERTGR